MATASRSRSPAPPCRSSSHSIPLRLGLLLSGFSWAYVLRPVAVGRPAGPLRLEARLWHQHRRLVGLRVPDRLRRLSPSARASFTAIFALRLVSGLAQSPVFPGNGRIVAAWFPTAERGRASAIFNASQYFALVAFAPLFGWLTRTLRLAELLLVHGRLRARARASRGGSRSTTCPNIR